MEIKQEMTKEILDLGLASFLSASGHKLLAVKPTGKKSIFSFEGNEKLEKDILDFYNRSARIDPLTYAETLRNLKALALQG